MTVEKITDGSVSVHWARSESEYTFSLALTYADEEGREQQPGPLHISEEHLLKTDVDRIRSRSANSD